MQLDFLTLYVFILLNSLVFLVVWAGVSRTYAGIQGAKYWLGATAMTMVGGLFMIGDGSEFGRVFMIVGNVFVVGGFVLMGAGLRAFYALAPSPWIGGLIVGLAAAAGVMADDTRQSQNIAYAGTQLVPLILCLAVLVRHGGGRLGAWVAIAGLGIAGAGQAMEAGLNLLRLAGGLSTEGYYSVASLLLLAAIFGAGVWNIGFLLMAIDRLHGRLSALAMRDDLTGLPNRRGFLDQVGPFFASRSEEGQPLALLLIDIDNFKEINDQLGHGMGDACLRHFSKLCASEAGPDDIAARLGGDEFAMLLVGAGPEEAAVRSEGLVQLVRRTPLLRKRQSVPMTVSVGVAALEQGERGSLAALTDDADKALYEAKRRGRNGVVLARDGYAHSDHLAAL